MDSPCGLRRVKFCRDFTTWACQTPFSDKIYVCKTFRFKLRGFPFYFFSFFGFSSKAQKFPLGCGISKGIMKAQPWNNNNKKEKKSQSMGCALVASCTTKKKLAQIPRSILRSLIASKNRNLVKFSPNKHNQQLSKLVWHWGGRENNPGKPKKRTSTACQNFLSDMMLLSRHIRME